MKRLIISIIVFAFFAELCAGQYRPRPPVRGASRVSPRRIVKLTEPRLKGQLSFEEALAKYRIVRQFTSQPLSLLQIGQLAWAGQGVTEQQRSSRAASPVNASYPITLYFATQDGTFAYNPRQHSLEQISEQDARGGLAASAVDKGAVATAGCDIIIASSVRSLTARYSKKARIYMLLEAGQIAQKIQLQAVCLELGAAAVRVFDARGVSNACRLPKNIEPVYIICVGYPAETAAAEKGGAPQAQRKRAALIIAGRNFRDEELLETRFVLNNAGVETVVVSSRPGPLAGVFGAVTEAIIALDGLMVDDFDAIIFLGGAGVREYSDNPVVLGIVREAANKRKVLGAISIAPAILAHSGVLAGVRATSFLTERDRLQMAGAQYTGVPVERDGLIITARDSRAARQFGQAIVDALFGR